MSYNDYITEKKEILDTLANNKYAVIALYDNGEGIVEIISVDKIKEEIAFKWVTFCPCYNCQVWSKGLYYTVITASISDIAHVARTVDNMTPEQAKKRRKESIKTDKIGGIFNRYKRLMNETKNKKTA